jgi:hypothetical protein
MESDCQSPAAGGRWRKSGDSAERLDLGFAPGWCKRSAAGELTSGLTADLRGTKRSPGDGFLGRRWRRFSGWWVRLNVAFPH